MSNEKFTEPTDSVETSVKKKAGRPKGSNGLANLKPFDHERSMAMQAKAAEARRARAEMRRRILATVCEVGVDKYVAKALKEQNLDLMTLCEKAVNMTGLGYKDSEENILHVKAETKSDVKVSGPLKFIIEDAVKTE